GGAVNLGPRRAAAKLVAPDQDTRPRACLSVQRRHGQLVGDALAGLDPGDDRWRGTGGAVAGLTVVRGRVGGGPGRDGAGDPLVTEGVGMDELLVARSDFVDVLLVAAGEQTDADDAR